MKSTTNKAKLQNNAAILERTPEWRETFDQAAKFQTELTALNKKVKGKRDKGTGVTGQFLELAKHYPSKDEWKTAWDAMRELYGTTKVPQVLSNAYSIIRQAMIKGLSGTEGKGKDEKPIHGTIDKADSYSKLRKAVSLQKGIDDKTSKASEAAKPINIVLGKFKSVHAMALEETKATIEGELNALLVKMQQVDKAAWDKVMGKDKAKAGETITGGLPEKATKKTKAKKTATKAKPTAKAKGKAEGEEKKVA